MECGEWESGIHFPRTFPLGILSCVSLDDKYIVSGSDKTVTVYRVDTKSLIAELQHSSKVVGVEFSPDGLILASRDCTTLVLLSLV